ncbi:MAG: ribosomal-processing cysteine protease Prp [Lachnospiraceae bacterium]|nr:ribosomal-processing cysteine protease Prp [Lachnospiraceae bacterium]
MISVTIRRSVKGDLMGFSVSGHALYDRKGKDIVCAAVSVLTINTVNAVEMLTEDLFSAESDENGGRLSFRFLGDEISDKGRVLLEALVLGLNGIREEYGEEYLSIVEKEE